MFLLSFILPVPIHQITYTSCLAHMKKVIGEFWEVLSETEETLASISTAKKKKKI